MAEALAAAEAIQDLGIMSSSSTAATDTSSRGHFAHGQPAAMEGIISGHNDARRFSVLKNDLANRNDSQQTKGFGL